MRNTRRRVSREKPAARWIRRFFWVANAMMLLGAAGVGGFVLGGLGGLETKLPKVQELGEFRPRLVTEVYSTELQPDGSEHHTLLARLYRENREWISLNDIPVNLIHATVAIEDRAFYKHRGINPKGILRAMVANLKAGKISQGGSTITQQLVKTIWLSPKRTLARKLKELVLAMQVERLFTKDEIMEMYLNEVCYGHGAYGVRAASKMYFGKEPKDLTLEQCALLAGLPRRPTYYSPINYPHNAKVRRKQVLDAMAIVHYITKQQAKKLTKLPLELDSQVKERGFASFRAPYFTHMVVRQLCDKYGMQMVYEGGLRVYTSLDMRIQKVADQEMDKWIKQLRKEHHISDSLNGQGAMAVVAPWTGDVIALVGGVGPYDKVQYNRAYPGPPYYGRQPGSSFKPYVWTAALESGYGPHSVVDTSGINIKQANGETWSPRGGHGSYPLNDALAHSINRVSVKLLLSVGASKVVNYASRMMGIPASRLRPVPSLALGTSELAPLEQAIGFSCFANGGYRVTPRFVRRITDANGNILVENPPQWVRVIQEPTAISMVKMMEGVVRFGTGTRARISKWPCAGKTGTAQDSRDTWFVGYTPDLCAAIWIGNDNHTPLHGGAYGGTFCAPLWGRFMSKAMAIYPVHRKFPTGEGVTATRSNESSQDQPKTITICTETGMLATPYCPQTKEVTLQPGEKMPPLCNVHTGPAPSSATIKPVSPKPVAHKPPARGSVTVTVCTESGLLATPNCPNTEERTFPPGEAPTQYCNIHGGKHGGGEKATATKAGAGKAGKTGKVAKPTAGKTAKPGKAAEATTGKASKTGKAAPAKTGKAGTAGKAPGAKAGKAGTGGEKASATPGMGGENAGGKSGGEQPAPVDANE